MTKPIVENMMGSSFSDYFDGEKEEQAREDKARDHALNERI